MNIRIIYDSETHHAHLYVGWGFSALLGKYLFDTGDKGSHLFENLRRLQCSIYNIKGVIISHDHWDHWGGLWNLLKLVPGIDVYGCPGFGEEFKEKVDRYGGHLIEVEGLRQISEEVYSTGEMEGTYKNVPIFEQAAVLKTNNGISICTGCAHPGIIAVAERVKSLFPDTPCNTIFGGFHLKSTGISEVGEIMIRLTDMGFTSILPGHCSGDYAKKQGTSRLYVGALFSV